MRPRDLLPAAALSVAPRPVSAADVTLTAAGATFPEPLYRKWFAAFSERFPGRAIAYRGVGSGEGVESLLKGLVDFAASDFPLSSSQSANPAATIWHVPTVVGGVTPVYRLDGLGQTVRFTPETLAGIYSGRIRRWNDPAMRADNRGVPLPSREIKAVHRSDRSGTTYVFTEYLAQVNSEWKSAVGTGDMVKWPVEGIAAAGSKGVLEAVAATPDSLGHIEFTYALDHRVSPGEIRNRDGRFVRADLTTLAAAAASAAAESFAPEHPAHVDITDAPGPGSYPLAAFTYLLIPHPVTDPAKASAVRDLLGWILTSGQKQCAALGYSPLPDAVARAVLRQTGLSEARPGG